MQKKMMVCLLLVATTLMAAGQQTSPTPQQPAPVNYLKKSKNQKTAAWILTGAGTAGLFITLSADMSQAVGGGLTTVFSLGTVEPEYKSYTVPYILSGAAIVGGVTLFLAAAKNKDRARAATTYLKMERTEQVQQGKLTRQAFPAVGVRMGL